MIDRSLLRRDFKLGQLPQGAQGPKGDPGAQGLKGATGARGLQGATGAQGLPGTPGSKGATGKRGPTGLTGAGTTGARGATGAQGTTGAQGATGPQGLQPVKAWAVVAADGTLLRGQGTVSASRQSTGSYVLTFDRVVTDCAVIGNVGGVEENVNAPAGVLSTNNGFNGTGSHATVIVTTFSLLPSGGAQLPLADENFHVALLC